MESHTDTPPDMITPRPALPLTPTAPSAVPGTPQALASPTSPAPVESHPTLAPDHVRSPEPMLRRALSHTSSVGSPARQLTVDHDENAFAEEMAGRAGSIVDVPDTTDVAPPSDPDDFVSPRFDVDESDAMPQKRELEELAPAAVNDPGCVAHADDDDDHDGQRGIVNDRDGDASGVHDDEDPVVPDAPSAANATPSGAPAHAPAAMITLEQLVAALPSVEVEAQVPVDPSSTSPNGTTDPQDDEPERGEVGITMDQLVAALPPSDSSGVAVASAPSTSAAAATSGAAPPGPTTQGSITLDQLVTAVSQVQAGAAPASPQTPSGARASASALSVRDIFGPPETPESPPSTSSARRPRASLPQLPQERSPMSRSARDALRSGLHPHAVDSAQQNAPHVSFAGAGHSASKTAGHGMSTSSSGTTLSSASTGPPSMRAAPPPTGDADSGPCGGAGSQLPCDDDDEPVHRGHEVTGGAAPLPASSGACGSPTMSRSTGTFSTQSSTGGATRVRPSRAIGHRESMTSNGNSGHEGPPQASSPLPAPEIPECPSCCSVDAEAGAAPVVPPPPAKPAAFDGTLKYTVTTGGFEQDTCSICLEKYTEEDPARVYECDHAFHYQCALAWLARSQDCPLCGEMIGLQSPRFAGAGETVAASHFSDHSASVDDLVAAHRAAQNAAALRRTSVASDVLREHAAARGVVLHEDDDISEETDALLSRDASDFPGVGRPPRRVRPPRVGQTVAVRAGGSNPPTPASASGGADRAAAAQPAGAAAARRQQTRDAQRRQGRQKKSLLSRFLCCLDSSSSDT